MLIFVDLSNGVIASHLINMEFRHGTGVVDLDLSGCEELTVAEVFWATRRMPRLSLLDVSGCRKLTARFANPTLGLLEPTEGLVPGLPFWLAFVTACLRPPPSSRAHHASLTCQYLVQWLIASQNLL